ncbi:peptide chain release factor N(5)-glutamine methyltransferase [Ruminococcus sp. Marseille-P6503]|uniref:peptide chain release factor N(5)-glutamine methyltransferase n=1 Tax=Ruminococcus sp. Marseille-P6503 TaxID=2364796 RepID=UPI000F532BF9|nr:peptide chain release factor N(5)-glutamine methyltransferase [Ruminococcus sp. Marseille-P6503]
MITYKKLIETVRQGLSGAGIENAAFEAKELLGLAIGTDCRSGAFLKAVEGNVSGEAAARFLALADRRKKGEPLQYILGQWEFYGLPFKVGEGVLIPRQDTEALVELAVEKNRRRNGLTVIDLCSGSGCIGISVEKNLDCKRVVCVEKSPEAVKYLERNIDINGSGAEIIRGDVFEAEVMEKAPEADLIVCNPPYLSSEDMANLQREVAFEPESALFGGADGMDFYRNITRLWKKKLRQGGMMIFEIGIGQEQEVMDIMIRRGFINVRARKDLCGIYRVVFGEIGKKRF